MRVEHAVASNPFEGFRCAPAVTIARCYAASGSIWRLFGRYGSYAVDLYVFFGSDHPLPEDVAAADLELARLRLPGARTTSTTAKAADCPRPTGTGYYDTTVRPSSGPPGSTATVSGRLPVMSEGGQDLGQTATEALAYWNLDFDHWTSLASARPLSAVAGAPVKLVGTQYVANRCTFHVQVTSPRGVGSIWRWATSTDDDNLADTHPFDCAGATLCRKSYSVSTQDRGRIVIRAQARDTDGQLSDESNQELRVR